MPWICPKCFRQFKHKISDHSCVKIDVRTHFIGKQPNVKAIYNKLIKEVHKFGYVNVSPVKGSILLKNVSTFMGIRISKRWVSIDFFLPIESIEFPIYKAMRYSKKKVVHFVQLEKPKEVDKQLLHWLKVSYDTCGKK